MAGLFERIQDLFSAGMVRHADLGTTVMKEADYTHRSLEMGGMRHQAGPHGETLGSLKKQRSEGEVWARVFKVHFWRRNGRSRVKRLV